MAVYKIRSKKARIAASNRIAATDAAKNFGRLVVACGRKARRT
jgi:hypothetical protein